MLKIAWNFTTKNFNRDEKMIGHLVDTEFNGRVPICGTHIKDLHVAEDASGYLADIKNKREPLFSDEDTLMCQKCVKAYLAPGTDAEKTETRRSRAAAKTELKKIEAKDFAIKTKLKEIVADVFLDSCPVCNEALHVQPRRGFNTKSAICDGCGIQWNFLVLLESDGSFWISGSVKGNSLERYRARGGFASYEPLTWEKK